jgi:ATP-dependent DNA helicase RecQ
MRILIVAKTRRGSGACVGGITEEGHSVRLIAQDAATNQHSGLEYGVGEVWDVDYAPDPDPTLPHIENVFVLSACRLRRSSRIAETICRFMPPVAGGPETLFDGLTQATRGGSLYIAERTGLPQRSTMFWTPDRPLQLDCEGKRLRYRYPTRDGGRTLTFVGFQEPLPEIPAGTLLRVSLAHWWRPQDRPEEESRCFVQLSGWFLGPESTVNSTSPGARSESHASQARPAHPAAAVSLSEQALSTLQRTFGFSRFLPLQGEAIARILRREDSLVIMPTGGGKSLCYQLPALLFEGLTVVVSPLVALMQDQVQQLERLSIPAACLNHMVALPEHVAITQRARHGAIKILYLAPEALLRPETLVLLQQSRLDCLAIDEAHCISDWGHDFRPDYRQLEQVRQRFPRAVCLALTATATPRVRDDIRRLLGIPRDGEFVTSFNRPNLFLSAQLRRDGLGQMLQFLDKRAEQCGIVYCGTRKQVDEVCAVLNANGWPALPYHAGLTDAVRRDNQARFLGNEGRLMVATVAFGMGIHKPDVRFVIHANLPRDLESYYQEIGRAGRDGQRGDCLLLYNRGDASTHRHFIRQGAPSEAPGREARLQAMMRFVEARGCRRESLLAYFGESPGSKCGNCDQCVPTEKSTLAPDSIEHRRAVAVPSLQMRRRFHEIGELFAAGQSIDHIAHRFDVLPETVIQNLEHFQESGGVIDPERLLGFSYLTTPERNLVLDAFERLGCQRLAPIHQACGGGLPFRELRLLRLYRLCRKP